MGYILLVKFLRSTYAFILRELTTTYGRHPGGFLWAFLEPIAAISLLTFIFSLAFRSPALGDNFALFYATGYLPFMLYTELSTKLSQSIKYSRQLLMYPAVNFLDALIARLVLTSIIQFVVFIIIFSLIFTFGNISHNVNHLNLINAFFMATFLGFGIGTLNCYLVTLLPVWERVWSILNRPTFIISGIFFIYQNVPLPYRDFLWYNPLIHVVGEMRGGFYPTYDTGYVTPMIPYSVALFTLCLGLLLLVRNHRGLLNSL